MSETNLLLQFEGWFQCRLATDPDPTWEPRGVSGYTRAVGRESNFDGVLYLQKEDIPDVDRNYRRGERKLRNYPPKGGGGPPGQVTEFAFTGAKDQRLMTAKRPAPQGDSYVSVFVATGTSGSHKETNGRTLTLLEVVDTVPMETKMVTVEADAMAKDIAATGHVALYGIYFDTDKTDLEPESTPTISEIAKLLKQDPKLTMYVVGHTDNVGGYEYNMGLSERRAAAVVKELTGKHGIQAARLKAAGAGPLAPVAPNDSDPGRAKNRRVELVKQ